MVIIQQDNARPHAKEDDATLATELKKDGWKMKLLNQPANSPDYNALDLGFFNSIQSIQHQKAPSNIDELIQVVQESYWEQSAETVENVFITVQKVMECSMIAEGSNKFKLPHMGKSKLRRQGQLQHILQVPEEVLFTAMEKLQDAN